MNKNISLGQKTDYIDIYSPELLFPIPRKIPRNFFGYDLWHGYELSWLNPLGKPMVAVAEFIFPCNSPHLIESKSFKLYLNSFNQTIVETTLTLQQLLEKDLSNACGAPVEVRVKTLNEANEQSMFALQGICLDDQNITCDCYHVEPAFLTTENNSIHETVYSHLLKSNCPVTNQPDWGSIIIEYAGKQINHAGLLRYIVSFRQHQDFHEACVERIFTDIMDHCDIEKLSVSAYYTRRGGLDINPVRSNQPIDVKPIRLWRQ